MFAAKGERDVHYSFRTRRHPSTPHLATCFGDGIGGALAFLVVGAVHGGLAMVPNPVSPLGMPLEYLQQAPVGDYFWPGMFLLGIAAASVLTVPGLLFHWEWP